MTRNALIKRALRLLGVLAPGESLPAAEEADAAEALQAMLGDWGTQKLTMHATVTTDVTLVADQASYTVGSGGNVDIARPTFIQEIGLIDEADPTNPIEKPIEVIRTAQRWQEVRLKALTGGRPEEVYYQKTFPLARLWPYPIPDIDTLKLRLYYRERVTGFSAAATNYTFPDGYYDALAFNLAERLAPEFGVNVPPNVARLAITTLTNIKRVNNQTPELRITQEVYGGASGRGAYDYRTDE